MAERGVCPVCGYKWALTKARTLVRHHIWYGKQSTPCKGSGQPVDEEPAAEHFAAPKEPTR